MAGYFAAHAGQIRRPNPSLAAEVFYDVSEALIHGVALREPDRLDDEMLENLTLKLHTTENTMRDAYVTELQARGGVHQPGQAGGVVAVVVDARAVAGRHRVDGWQQAWPQPAQGLGVAGHEREHGAAVARGAVGERAREAGPVEYEAQKDTG